MQYKDGTCQVIFNSNIVAGTDTLWLGHVEPGDWFKIDDRAPIYQIASVDSNIQITLTVNYGEANGSGLSYCIVTDFTPVLSLPFIFKGDIDWPDIINAAMSKIDASALAGGTWSDHKARHENGGADEINVTGLSGLLDEVGLFEIDVDGGLEPITDLRTDNQFELDVNDDIMPLVA